MREFPIFFHGVSDGILAMKQSQDVLLQAIKNQHLQPNQDSNLQMYHTYYTCLARNLDMDLTNFVTEFRTFSNNVNTNMLAMKKAQNAMLRAISIDPKTLPRINTSARVDETQDAFKPLNLADMDGYLVADSTTISSNIFLFPVYIFKSGYVLTFGRIKGWKRFGRILGMFGWFGWDFIKRKQLLVVC